MGCVLRAISEISENAIKKMLGKSLLSYEQLETVLRKIESVINGRPLGNLSEYDLIYGFTPNYLSFMWIIYLLLLFRISSIAFLDR